jgi:hypothetical protein
MIGAHASFTLSKATLAACVDAVRSTGTGLHPPLRTSPSERRARFGVSVAERLAHGP